MIPTEGPVPKQSQVVAELETVFGKKLFAKSSKSPDKLLPILSGHNRTLIHLHTILKG